MTAPRYVDSLNGALHSLLKEHEEVLILGEDLLDPYGGAFKVTRGLSTAFPGRVLPTPISEAAITGAGIGLAMRGMRPVVELMFGDFLTLCVDQLVNHAAKFRFMYDGQVTVPLVVRTPMGGYRGYGPTHSQTLESLLTGVPLLEMIAPSHYHDPGALLARAVLGCEDPVLFIEHKLLYPRRLVASGETDPETSLRVTALSGEGSPFPTVSLRMVEDEAPAVTVVTYGGMAALAAEAASRAFVSEEIVAEVIVPSRIKPLPIEDLLPSVRASGKVLVIEEGPRTGGWGAEVSSRLHEAAFDDLRAPVARIGAADLPIPAAPGLEREVLPSVEAIGDAIARLAG
ncbi:MAG TPA: transketolase C-terminal domain-containing protein [Candidatus Saccharimonadales bacterium]|nr:transketolase C-terminal domain-containing protein [Candidatus Saccharimonadales bacterium]